jgi:hypothetical protein
MLKVLEFSWMFIACLGASLGAFKWATESFASAIWFFLFTVVALIFWIIRRKQRISMEKRD